MFTFRAGVIGAVCGLLGLPLLGQQPGQNAGEARDEHREKVKLMDAGQATLIEAVQIAESHIKGKALEVDCVIVKAYAPVPPIKEPGPGALPPGSGPLQPRLMYTLVCFAEDRSIVLRVDGLERTVIGGPVATREPSP